MHILPIFSLLSFLTWVAKNDVQSYLMTTVVPSAVLISWYSLQSYLVTTVVPSAVLISWYSLQSYLVTTVVPSAVLISWYSLQSYLVTTVVPSAVLISWCSLQSYLVTTVVPSTSLLPALGQPRSASSLRAWLSGACPCGLALGSPAFLLSSGSIPVLTAATPECA